MWPSRLRNTAKYSPSVNECGRCGGELMAGGTRSPDGVGDDTVYIACVGTGGDMSVVCLC